MARVMAPIVVALLLVGCATPVAAPGGSGVPIRSAAPAPEDRLQRQAHDALEQWAAAVRENGGASITFVGELTSQIGDWEDEVGDNNKSALDAGMVETATPLPQERPGRREVKWVDGTTVDVEVFSAEQALAELTGSANADCEGCEPLVITDANLATGLVETSEGPAEVPMWVYSLRDTAVRITRVAVDAGVSVDPGPWAADDPPLGISIEMAIGKEDSERLEVEFIGWNPACEIEYDIEAVESQLAVVVSVVEREPKPCTADGRLLREVVTLDEPLGKRAVLEVRQGLPVPVRTP